MSRAARPPWNHNIAYFPFIEKVARAKPRRTAIDVGTGDGMLAARLAGLIPSVVGLDLHREQVDAARAVHASTPALRFERGDLLTAHPTGAPFDFVACSSTLHHVELTAGLEALRALTAPGGTLVIVGLANNSTALDWVLEVLRLVPVRIARARRGWYEHGAPKADPTVTLREVRDAAASILPGSVLRRRLYWRYTVVWERPSA